jgi:hypothetical protein
MSTEIKELINTGKFVSGTYVKKNGDVTSFYGRAGVHKYTKGGQSYLNPENVLIWDLKRKRYMAMRPEAILTIKANKIELKLK